MPFEFEAGSDKYQAGREAMQRSDYYAAIELFEESVRLSPHFKTLELLGECKIKLDRPSDAIVPLAAAVGLGTNAFKAMYLLAQAYAQMGDNQDALKYVEKALQMKPDFKAARELKESLGVKSR